MVVMPRESCGSEVLRPIPWGIRKHLDLANHCELGKGVCQEGENEWRGIRYVGVVEKYPAVNVERRTRPAAPLSKPAPSPV